MNPDGRCLRRQWRYKRRTLIPEEGPSRVNSRTELTFSCGLCEVVLSGKLQGPQWHGRKPSTSSSRNRVQALNKFPGECSASKARVSRHTRQGPQHHQAGTSAPPGRGLNVPSTLDTGEISFLPFLNLFCFVFLFSIFFN